MSDHPRSSGNDLPLDGGDPMAEGTATDVAEQRAAQDPTARDATRTGGGNDTPAYDSDEQSEPQAGEQGGQPNLTPDPAVSGRRSNFGQGSTDDSPGTPSGL
ncbi:hypothetical protein [Spirilliplanes yamanashiensis]|uniref:Uncharacterized protein n=1 Tax=Spirilliplanes yamanashiensis TaxID=42233 RepID=A0A8J3Y2Z6_9ACTN|nr:hypothetical protein [Spirilliplanes yamanashiensis]MDP9814309.1 hypothetical protein [Spirilliplanes yamanashiensis]GIJ00708.1 hypothetical protein Sya03_00600 [Spirilliplanes yamanashiensis]